MDLVKAMVMYSIIFWSRGEVVSLPTLNICFCYSIYITSPTLPLILPSPLLTSTRTNSLLFIAQGAKEMIVVMMGGFQI